MTPTPFRKRTILDMVAQEVVAYWDSSDYVASAEVVNEVIAEWLVHNNFDDPNVLFPMMRDTMVWMTLEDRIYMHAEGLCYYDFGTIYDIPEHTRIEIFLGALADHLTMVVLDHWAAGAPRDMDLVFDVTPSSIELVAIC